MGFVVFICVSVENEYFGRKSIVHDVVGRVIYNEIFAYFRYLGQSRFDSLLVRFEPIYPLAMLCLFATQLEILPWRFWDFKNGFLGLLVISKYYNRVKEGLEH